MSNTAKYFCLDRIVSPENEVNESALEGAISRSKYQRWQPGDTLHVAFLEGFSMVQQRIAYYAQQWEQYANILFRFDNHPEAKIRIAFQPGVGTWSTVGTDAEKIPAYEPTMNFDDLTPNSSEEEFSYYALHEFGHVLGMVHEHQSPKGGIKWNKAVVKESFEHFPEEYFAGGRDKWFERNIFRKYNFLQARASTFDPTSIMAYYIPREWTLNSVETHRNVTLSETDKRFIRKWYPW